MALVTITKTAIPVSNAGLVVDDMTYQSIPSADTFEFTFSEHDIVLLRQADEASVTEFNVEPMALITQYGGSIAPVDINVGFPEQKVILFRPSYIFRDSDGMVTGTNTGGNTDEMTILTF